MSEFKPVILSLPSSAHSLAVEILPYGLTIHRVLVEAGGCTHDIVVGPESPQSHATQKYTNTIIGRYANRIPAGTHILERHGIRNEFTPVANESPRVSLHGGPEGFDTAIWTTLSPDEPAALFSTAELGHLSPSTSESAHAIFRLISESGDQGYPGKLIVEALVALVRPGSYYEIHDNYAPHEASESDLGSIVIVYRAKLDEGENKVVTPVNLAQHWGFNLDASLKDEPISVKDHILTIKADRFAELDSDSLGTGLFLQTADYPPHVHTSKRIGERFPEKSYDHFYLFPNPVDARATTRISLAAFNAQFDLIGGLLQTSGEEPRRRNRPEPVVEISSSKSGLKLTFDTNQSGVMFYANGMADSSAGARKRIHGGSGLNGNGDSYGPGSAAFLEFHAPLAAFLDPKNKNGEDGLITTGELYHAYVRCDISLKPSEEGK